MRDRLYPLLKVPGFGMASLKQLAEAFAKNKKTAQQCQAVDKWTATTFTEKRLHNTRKCYLIGVKKKKMDVEFGGHQEPPSTFYLHSQLTNWQPMSQALLHCTPIMCHYMLL